MRSNRGKDTGPELTLRSALWAAGVRGYRLHRKTIPGRPDLSFGRQSVAVFVNGCYWHRCPRCNLPMPKKHKMFWKRKFTLNKERDGRKRAELKAEGWRVLTIWECEIREDIDACVSRVKEALRGP